MSNWYNSFFASTIEAYKNELIDNYFDENVIANAIKARSKVVSINSGVKIEVPLLLGKANGAKAYSYYDTFDISPSGGFSRGDMKFANFAVPVALADQEVEENMGEARIFEITKAKIMQAEATISALVNSQMYVANASNDGGKGLYGLPDMVEALAIPTTEYMGVSPTTETAWRNKYKAGAVGSLITLMGQLYRACKDGQDKPDLIVTTDLGEEKYETALTAPMSSTTGLNVGLRYTSPDKGDAGYGSLLYKGIPIEVDKACVDYTSLLPRYHFLNTKYLGFLLTNLETTDFVRSGNQVAKSAFIKLKSQFFTNNRRRQGKLDITS